MRGAGSRARARQVLGRPGEAFILRRAWEPRAAPRTRRIRPCGHPRAWRRAQAGPEPDSQRQARRRRPERRREAERRGGRESSRERTPGVGTGDPGAIQGLLPHPHPHPRPPPYLVPSPGTCSSPKSPAPQPLRPRSPSLQGPGHSRVAPRTGGHGHARTGAAARAPGVPPRPACLAPRRFRSGRLGPTGLPHVLPARSSGRFPRSRSTRWSAEWWRPWVGSAGSPRPAGGKGREGARGSPRGGVQAPNTSNEGARSPPGPLTGAGEGHQPGGPRAPLQGRRHQGWSPWGPRDLSDTPARARRGSPSPARPNPALGGPLGAASRWRGAEPGARPSPPLPPRQARSERFRGSGAGAARRGAGAGEAAAGAAAEEGRSPPGGARPPARRGRRGEAGAGN